MKLINVAKRRAIWHSMTHWHRIPTERRAAVLGDTARVSKRIYSQESKKTSLIERKKKKKKKTFTNEIQSTESQIKKQQIREMMKAFFKNY